jgi:RimJ/RimL family protein N-acetyltransferase
VADELWTTRLRLRRWSRHDLAPLSEVFAKPEVWQFPFGRGFTRDETERFLAYRIAEQATGGWSEWAVELGDSGRLLGYVGLSEPHFLPEVMPTVEIGWRLDPDVWGRGFATEAARAALDDGFSRPGLDDVVSIYEPDNKSSGRVMVRLGMRFDRDTRHPTRDLPLRVYRLSRIAWKAQTHRDESHRDESHRDESHRDESHGDDGTR